MAEIELTSGDVVLVSDRDYQSVMKFKWNYKKYKNQTYARRSTAHGDPILIAYEKAAVEYFKDFAHA